MASAGGTVREHRLFIDGEPVAASGEERIWVANPASGERVASVPVATPADVERAVRSARAAFAGGWGETSPGERSAILAEVGRRIRARTEELIDLEVEESGRPRAEVGAVDVPETADCFEYYAAAARLVKGEVISPGSDYFDYTLHEPAGVVAALVPWNFPLNLASWKVAPALAMGNAVVLKPSELTPTTALELAAIAIEAGLPPGVLNVITGDGAVSGDSLVRHPDVDMVAFTGGVETGRRIAAAAAEHGKPCSLELGGKSAVLVFEDCDLDAAAASVLEGAFFAQGENCCAGSRLLVAAPVREELIERVAADAAALRVGDPADPETQVGALGSPRHLEAVLARIEEGRAAGGAIVVGGERAAGAGLEAGAFVAPTVLADPPQDSRIVQEEVFGPVLVANAFGDEEEAIELANGTPYDLAAGIWTGDVSRAHRVARRLRAGSVWINTYNRVFNDAPFGGHRGSGSSRDLGTQALAQYGRVKNVCLAYEPGGDRWFPAR